MKKGFWQTSLTPAGWGFLTGVLFATSYPPFVGWALFFAFVPLWLYWFKATSLKEVVIAGFVAQFTLTLIGFNWIAHLVHEYGHLPMIVGVLVLLSFCCFASLNVPLAGAIVWLIQRRVKLRPLWFFILLAVVSGFCDCFYPTIFQWNTGYPLLFSHFKSAQLAEFIGFNLLSVFVYLANGAFALGVLRYPRQGWGRPLIIFIIGLFLFETAGLLTEKHLGQEDASINALLVQPNIGNYDKFYAERGDGYQEPIIKKDFEITRQGLNESATKPDLIVWPETSFPANLDPYFSNSFYAKQLHDFVDRNEVPMVVGSYSEDPITQKNRKMYNAVFNVKPHSPPEPGYRKKILLAFGEYFPGAESFPFLKTLVPEISDFGRGNGPVTFDTGKVRVTPLICYEGLDTSYVQQSMEGQGQILVNVTNDSWFGDTFEPRQHLLMTLARTIEFRRPLIRVTNTGISMVGDARGKILIKGPLNTAWSKTVSVPYFTKPYTTLFSAIEPFQILIFLALAIAALFLGRFVREKPRT